MTEKRITLTGSWVEVKRRIPPEEMTDKQLKKKVCSSRRDCCANCPILKDCAYGKEYVRRLQQDAARESRLE